MSLLVIGKLKINDRRLQLMTKRQGMAGIESLKFYRNLCNRQKLKLICFITKKVIKKKHRVGQIVPPPV